MRITVLLRLNKTKPGDLKMASVDDNLNQDAGLESDVMDITSEDDVGSPLKTRLVGLATRVIPPKVREFCSVPRNLGFIAGGFFLLAVSIWWLLIPEPKSFIQQLDEALELLADPDDFSGRQTAKKIARTLINSGYRDPSFARGAEYVLGIAYFRDAEDEDAGTSETTYRRAIKYLEQAGTIDKKYRPNFVYALGSSLHSTGSRTKAIPLLKQAIAD